MPITNNLPSEINLFTFLEWIYDINLDDEQKTAITQEMVLGLTNDGDKSDIDLLNKVSEAYVILKNNPNIGKVNAREYFKDLFLLPGSFDAHRLLFTIHKTIEELRPGITGVKPNPLFSSILNEGDLSRTATNRIQGSTGTPFNSTSNDSFQSGIYRGFKFQSYSGPIMSESGMYASYFTFYSDGSVLYGHPDTDAAGIFGRYQVIGKVVDITWNDGEKLSSPIAPDGSVTFYGCQYSLFQKFF